MNYLAHALPFLDRPYFAAGTGVPDWLMVVDRQVRVRTKHALPLVEDRDPQVAAVAGGILQHLRDDLRFHETRAFAETSLELAAAARGALAADAGFRPSLLGHLLVEILLDAALAAEEPGRLTGYYQAMEAIDPAEVEAAVNCMAPQPTERLATMIRLFRQERILWDYLEDGRLMIRLNQVMRRLGFAPLPDEFAGLLPSARRLIAARRRDLLEGIPVAQADIANW
jgi:hypothetical protein